MSVFDKIRKRNRGNAETFAFKVTGFGKTDDGIGYAEGERIDTGQPVKVFLRQLSKEMQEKLSKKFPRPEINEIKKKVKPGGILRADSAFEQNGMYAARWLSLISKKPGHGAATVLPARVLPVYRHEESGRESQSIEMLMPDGVKTVADQETFDKALMSALSLEHIQKAGLPANTVPIAVIRLVNKEDPDDVYHVTVRARRIRSGDDENEEWRTVYGEEALANLPDRTRELLDEVRSEFVGNENIETSIVPGGMLHFGPKSVGEKNTAGFEVNYVGVNRDGETVERTSYLFRRAVISFRSIEDAPDGEMFVTGAVPVQYNAPMSRDGIDWHDKETWAKRLSQMSQSQGAVTADADADVDTTEEADLGDELEDDIPDFGDEMDDIPELDDQELEEMVSTVRGRQSSKKSASLSI